MKLAITGSGISGLAAAHGLHGLAGQVVWFTTEAGWRFIAMTGMPLKGYTKSWRWRAP